MDGTHQDEGVGTSPTPAAAVLCLDLSQALLPVRDSFEEMAATAARVLSSAIGDYCAVALLDVGEPRESCRAARHRDPARDPLLRETLGAADVLYFADLAEVLLSGTDVRGAMLEVLATRGTPQARYLPSIQPYLDLYGVVDALLVPLTTSSGRLVGTVVCGRDRGSPPYTDEASLLPVAAGQLRSLVEVSEAEEAERRSRRRFERLAEHREELLGGLLLREQEERGLLAEEIHDDMLQRLATAMLRLELVSERVGDRPAVRDALDRTVAAVAAAGRGLRRVLVDLEPAGGRPEELAAALHRLSGVTGLSELTVEGELGEVSGAMADLVVRVVREVLTATRPPVPPDDPAHPTSETASVRLSRSEEHWCVRVAAPRPDLPGAPAVELAPATATRLAVLDGELTLEDGEAVLVLPRAPHAPQPHGEPGWAERAHEATRADDPAEADHRLLRDHPEELLLRMTDEVGVLLDEPQRGADRVVRLLAEAVDGYAALAFFPPHAEAPLKALHHVDAARLPWFRETVGSASARGLVERARAQHAYRLLVAGLPAGQDPPEEPSGFIPETVPYVQRHGFSDAVILPIMREEEPVGLLACGRDGDQPPFEESTRTLVTAAAEQLRVILVLAAARAETRLVTEASAVAADRSRDLLPSLVDAHRRERRWVSEMLLVLALDHLEEALDDLDELLDTDEHAAGHSAGDVAAELGSVRAVVSDAVEGVLRLQLDLEGPEAAPIEDDVRRAAAELFDGTPGVRCEVRGELRDLPARTTAVLRRAVREALTNARRHARATEVVVTMHGDATAWTVEVHDDGVGLSTAPDPGPGHLGLRSMQRRLASVGGRCVIDERPHGGTVVTLSSDAPPG